MYARVSSFFTQNATLLNAYAPLKAEIDRFQVDLEALNVAEGKQAILISNEAARKQRLHQEWTDKLTMLNATARAYARRYNTDLLSIIYVDAKQYLNTSAQEAAERGKASLNLLRTFVQDMIDKEYDIQTSAIDDLEQEILTFEEIIATPNIKEDIKQQGTLEMEIAFSQIDETLKIADDLIRTKFSDANQPLVDQYRLARKIGDPATNHTTLVAKVLQNNQPTWKAEVLIRELGRTDLTDIDGIAEIEEFKPGEYTIEVRYENTLVATQVVRIPLGKTIILTFNI